MKKALVYVPQGWKPPRAQSHKDIGLLREILEGGAFKKEAELEREAPDIYAAIQSVGGILPLGVSLVGFAVSKTEAMAHSQEISEGEASSPWKAINQAAQNKQNFTIDVILFREEKEEAPSGEYNYPILYRVPLHFTWVTTEDGGKGWDVKIDWQGATELCLTYFVPKEYLPKRGKETTSEKSPEELEETGHIGAVDTEDEEKQPLHKVLLNKIAELLEKVRATLRSSG